MKKLILYSMFCLSGLFLVNTSKADPIEDICPNLPDGYYPNYTNCYWFYKCDNHKTFVGMCPNGLVFDVATSTCNLKYLSLIAASYCP